MNVIRVSIFSCLCASLGCEPPELGGTCGGDCDAPPGAECLDSSECTGVCKNEACTVGCVETSECENGEVCTPAQGDDGVVRTVCVASWNGALLFGDPCTDDSECREGICEGGTCTRSCLSRCGERAACEPVSSSRFGVSLSLAVCRPDHAQAALSLGSYTVDGTPTDEINFTIPPGLASFTIVLLDWDGTEEQRVGFESLIAPDGTTLLDASDGEPDVNPPTVPYPGSASVMVPSSDSVAARPQAGTWKLRAGIYQTTDFVTYTPAAGTIDEIRVVFERSGEVGGALDLNLHFSPATGIRADTAAQSAFVITALRTLDDFYRQQLGVSLANVSFADIGTEHDAVADFAQIRTICASHSLPGPNRSAVNVFFTDDLLGGVGGVAGGIPGPPGVFLAPGSGILVQPAATAANTGLLLAHEIGHFLGLQHTTNIIYDADAGAYRKLGVDAISDTPECSAASLQECPDYRNAMFPFFPLTGLSFSPGQIDVIRRNPLFYETLLAAGCDDADRTLDITGHGFAAGSTGTGGGSTTGSCGGNGAPERWHRYRLDTPDLAQLDVEVVGVGYAPTVYVRRADCGGTDILCDSADADTALVVSATTPTPGSYFIAVDGRDGAGGDYSLEVREVP